MELYIHIPFCTKKCRYCSFVSFVGKETYIETYIDLILKEASSRLNEVSGPITTVFLGGGTPSLLLPSQLLRLIRGLRSVYGLNEVTEFTSEANPGTLTNIWADAAIRAGINRLSLGMQASQSHLLGLLGRIHNMDTVLQSVLIARRAGFSNINLDLIFGIPTQSPRDWTDTLNAAVSLTPEHISTYGLIPEDGTPLFDDIQEKKLSLPDPDLERNMYDDAIRILKCHGYHQYEISNFARNGYTCRHNIGYWSQEPYIGLGISASSMTGLCIDKNGMSYTRKTNPSSFDSYREMIENGVFKGETDYVTPGQSRFETMMLGLRMNSGVSDICFFNMHGLYVEQCYGSKLNALLKNGLLKHDHDHWRLTRRGFDIQNSILTELMD